MNLATKWRDYAKQIEKWSPPVAEAFRECASELEAQQRAEGAVMVGLTEASVLSGYHVNSLSDMLRDGRLANHGTKRRPKVLVSELPAKPGPKQFDPAVLAFRAVGKRRA